MFFLSISFFSSAQFLERVHQNFFSHCSLEELDVRSILEEEQKKILEGCCILFSRVIPMGEKNPEKYQLWRMAEQLGAKCTSEMGEHVTHVVANGPGTCKVCHWSPIFRQQ